MNKLMKTYSTAKKESKQQLNSNRLFFAHTMVFLLLLINAVKANTIPGMAILVVAMIIPFFLKPAEITAYIVAFSMMGTGIQVAYIAFSCLIALLKSKREIKSVTLFSILIFVFYELIHLIAFPSDDIVEFFRYAVVYILLFFIMFIDYDLQERIRVVDSYIYGTIFSILHIFIETFNATNGNLIKFIDGSLRFGYSEQLGFDLTMSADPNSVGQGCSIVIVVSLMLIMMGYKSKKYYASMLIALLAGTLTISKTFLISLILIITFTIIFAGSWTSYKTMGRRVLLILLVFLGCYIVLKVNPDYIDNIFLRVDDTDITTGRVTNAIIYLEHLMNNANHLLLGVGMQNVGEKIGFTGSPHAAIIEGMVCWGFIGFFAISFVIIYAIVCGVRRNKTRILNWVPLMVYFVITQTTQLFRLRDRVFTIVLMIVVVGVSKKGDKKNEQEKVCVTSN